MAVTYRGVKPGFPKGKNSLGVRTYTNAFLLETSARADGVFQVGSSPFLPTIGSTFSGDPSAFCTSLTIENSAPWKGWTATAEYTTDVFEPSSEDPQNDEPRISWSSEIYQEPIFRDTDSNAILNSAGDYFIDPVPTRDVSHLIARITQNVASVPAWALSYQNAINNGAITIDGLSIAAGLAKVQRIDIGQQELRGNYTFRKVALEIHIHRDGWNLEPLQCGFNHKKAGVVKPILVKDMDSSGASKDDSPVTQPVPLDDDGAIITDPTPATAKFGDFTIYQELNLANLPGVS
jgi:hypothetical protein